MIQGKVGHEGLHTDIRHRLHGDVCPSSKAEHHPDPVVSGCKLRVAAQPIRCEERLSQWKAGRGSLHEPSSGF